MSFFLETLVGGLLAGVMYALVAIGFVLIYKASGVFNFAQGAMVLCAALTFVTLREHGLSFWFALAIALVVMVTLAIAVERLVLRPLINRPPLTLFMATLGLSFVIEGLSQFLMGASVHELDLGIVDVPIQIGPILVSQLDLVAAASAGVLVLTLSLLFSRTRIGISLRAIADDPQAALSIGIRLPRLWRIVWGVAGVVSIVAGLLWGARQGVQFALTLVVLKALPVLIVGGFTWIGGAMRVVSSSVPAKAWRRSISVRSWAAVFPTGSPTPSRSRFS
jgi:branched-chain amino acid transport system permease protein